MSKARIKYRIRALIIDTAVILLASFIILLVSGNIATIIDCIAQGEVSIDSFGYLNIMRSFLLIEIFLVFYLCLIPLYAHGQTLGMYLFKIRFVHENGREVGFGALFLRQILVNCLAPMFSLGMIWIVNIIIMIYRKDNATLADALSRVKVVDKLDY